MVAWRKGIEPTLIGELCHCCGYPSMFNKWINKRNPKCNISSPTYSRNTAQSYKHKPGTIFFMRFCERNNLIFTLSCHHWKCQKIDQLYKIPILFCKIIISLLEKKWYRTFLKHPFQMMSDSENIGTWKRVLQKVKKKKKTYRASTVNKLKERNVKPGALNWWEPMKTSWHEYMETPHIR